MRVALVIKVLKETMECVQIPVSPAKVPQDHLVCQDPQDPEVCLVLQDHRGPKALRVIWVFWVPAVPLDLRVRREIQGPRESVIVQMGRMGCQERRGPREIRVSRDQ